MNAVLISIQPRWCELIASGKKTVEVRKTKPKLETPFKVYIYCAKKDNMGLLSEAPPLVLNKRVCNGKVIGEFVCDEITPLFNVATTSWNLLAGNVHEYAKSLVRMARLTEGEMRSYANGKNCYAWHISDLVIYDKPKELSEFKRDCGGVTGDIGCRGCEYYYTENNESIGFHEECMCNYLRPLKKPPQSWCYVEELSE